MKIDIKEIKDVQLFSLGSIFFENEENNKKNYKKSFDFLKETKEIDGLELFKLDLHTISKSGKFLVNINNKMEIFQNRCTKKRNI